MRELLTPSSEDEALPTVVAMHTWVNRGSRTIWTERFMALEGVAHDTSILLHGADTNVVR